MKILNSLFVAILASLLACQSPRQRDVRFEVRGLTISPDESEGFTSFMRKATVVAMGSDAQRMYNVLYRVKHVSGGDPAKTIDPNRYAAVLVVGGVGEFADYLGTRKKKTSYQEAETWQPEQVELEQIGYLEWTHETVKK